jgi:hypothetical protein
MKAGKYGKNTASFSVPGNRHIVEGVLESYT